MAKPALRRDPALRPIQHAESQAVEEPLTREGMSRAMSKTLRFSLEGGDLEPEWERRLERFANAVVRGTGTGFCLRGGLNLAALLFALLARRRKAQQAKRGGLVAQVRDTLRYTAFLGAFAGVYVAVDESLAALFGNKRTSKWRAAVAGVAAGPTILLTGPKTRHMSLALYVLIRGITLLVRCGNKPSTPPLLRRLLAPTRWKHGDTALMCLSTSQIGYSWIMAPNTLPPAYINFLNRHGDAPEVHLRAVKELAERNSAGRKLGTLRALQGTRWAAFAERQPCGFLHEGQTCNQHFLTYVPQEFLRALPVYLPVYFLPALLVHRQRLLTGPQAGTIWAKGTAAALRSSLFLALYCGLAWRGACAGFQGTGTVTGTVIAGSCWTAGLATLVEKKSRRMELAFYCLSRAVESFALCVGQWGWVRRDAQPARTDVLLFSAATAAILHCYSDDNGRHRDVFRSKYLNVLDFILGNTGVEQGKLKHVPSTSDLLGAAMPQAIAAEARRAASDLGTALQEYSPPGSPRSDGSDRGASFDRGLHTGYSQSLGKPPSAGMAHIDPDQGP